MLLLFGAVLFISGTDITEIKNTRINQINFKVMKKLIYTLLLILTSAVCFSNGNNIHTIYSFAKTQSDTIFMVSVKGDKVTKINGYKNPDHLSKLNKALAENSTKVLKLSK